MSVETPHSIYTRFLSALHVLIHTSISSFLFWLHWVLVASCRIFSCGMWDLGP